MLLQKSCNTFGNPAEGHQSDKNTDKKQQTAVITGASRSRRSYLIYKSGNRKRLQRGNQRQQKLQQGISARRCRIRLKYDFYCIQRMYFFQTSVLSAVCPNCSLLFTLSRCAFHLSARIVYVAPQFFKILTLENPASLKCSISCSTVRGVS